MTYFLRITNPLQMGVTYDVSYRNDISKGASNYRRQPGSKKCLEKCVNASHKEESLYNSCFVSLVVSRENY
jgi:hypothetical protein